MTEKLSGRAGRLAGGLSWNSTDGATSYKLGVVRNAVAELMADGEQLASMLRQASALCQSEANKAEDTMGRQIWNRRALALCYIAGGGP